MELGLRGVYVVVTGSSRGIGSSIAKGFLRERANVILTGRNRDDLLLKKEEFASIYPDSDIIIFQGDLGSSADVDSLCDFIEEETGSIDHLVCNIGSGKSVPPLEENEIEVGRMININLMTSVLCVGRVLPFLEKNAARQRNTSIIFISSICGEEALGCPVAYATAKSALRSYAANISRPLGRRGIRVNTITPGNIIFDGSTWEEKLDRDPEKVSEMIDREVPLGRLGLADEIADVAVFLASERASFVSGANWIVDGGQTRNL